MENNLNSLCGPFLGGGGVGVAQVITTDKSFFLERFEKEKEFFFQGSTLNVHSIFDTQDIVKISELNSNDAH